MATNQHRSGDATGNAHGYGYRRAEDGSFGYRQPWTQAQSNAALSLVLQRRHASPGRSQDDALSLTAKPLDEEA